MAIWVLRNNLAHTNQSNITEYKITGMSYELKLGRKSAELYYLPFVLGFLKFINETLVAVETWEKYVLEKWPANDVIA